MRQNFENIKKTDEHVVKMWEPLHTKIDKNYKYVNDGIIFKILSYITAFLAFIVFYPLISLFLGVKTKGRAHLKALKSGGIVVANHSHSLDCIMLITHGVAPRFPYIMTRKGTFDVPFLRHFIRLGRAIPIPNDISAKREFSKSVESILEKDILIIFPEGSMWPLYDKLRPFKKGAFHFAAKTGKPIVPACVTQRPPNKFYGFFGKRKPLVTIEFLPPVMPLQDEQELKEKTYSLMREVIER